MELCVASTTTQLCESNQLILLCRLACAYIYIYTYTTRLAWVHVCTRDEYVRGRYLVEEFTCTYNWVVCTIDLYSGMIDHMCMCYMMVVHANHMRTHTTLPTRYADTNHHSIASLIVSKRCCSGRACVACARGKLETIDYKPDDATQSTACT